MFMFTGSRKTHYRDHIAESSCSLFNITHQVTRIPSPVKLSQSNEMDDGNRSATQYSYVDGSVCFCVTFAHLEKIRSVCGHRRRPRKVRGLLHRLEGSASSRLRNTPLPASGTIMLPVLVGDGGSQPIRAAIYAGHAANAEQLRRLNADSCVEFFQRADTIPVLQRNVDKSRALHNSSASTQVVTHNISTHVSCGSKPGDAPEPRLASACWRL